MSEMIENDGTFVGRERETKGKPKCSVDNDKSSAIQVIQSTMVGNPESNQNRPGQSVKKPAKEKVSNRFKTRIMKIPSFTYYRNETKSREKHDLNDV